MINVKISKDIRTYKTKVLFGLTGRQLLSSIIAILIGVVLNMFIVKYIGEELASWLTIIIVMPIFAIGWINIQGMTAEKFFKQFIQNELINKKLRIFQNDNIYEYIENEEKRESIKSKKLEVKEQLKLNKKLKKSGE